MHGVHAAVSGTKAASDSRPCSRGRTSRRGPHLLVLLAAVLAVFAGGAASASAATLPAGFSEEVVLNGLVNPTAMRFAPDGRIFVAEKRGMIKEFDGLFDTTP